MYIYIYIYIFFLQCFDAVGWTWGADTMSVKQKPTQLLGFLSCFRCMKDAWLKKSSSCMPRKKLWRSKVEVGPCAKILKRPPKFPVISDETN